MTYPVTMLNKNTFIKFMPMVATVRWTRAVYKNSTARLIVNKDNSHVILQSNI